MALRRGRGSSGWLGGLIITLILLVVGTVLGRAFPLGPLSLHVGFAPLSLNLYVASVSVALDTNVLGLVGAVCGILLTRFI